jgi:hypothetical protein
MDFNLLIWAVYGFQWIRTYFLMLFHVQLPRVRVAIFDNLYHDFSGLCFYQLPLLGVSSVFVLYVILRWRKILYEDLGGQILVPQTNTEPSDFRKMLAKTLETESQWIANVLDRIDRLQNYCLTTAGLRAKRNVIACMIAAFLVGYIILQTRMFWAVFPETVITSTARTFFYGINAWDVLVQIMIQALFFRIVSFGIEISEDESALERTPPKISAEHWTLEELTPQSRRRILCNAAALLAAIPFCMLLQSKGWEIVTAIWMHTQLIPLAFNNVDLDTLIKIEAVIVAIAVLWGSRYPRRRFLGYALLFLASGLVTVCCAEWTPVLSSGVTLLNQFLFWWLDTESQNQIFRHQPMSGFYFHHCFSITWFIYSLLAAGICYGLHRRSFGQHTR